MTSAPLQPLQLTPFPNGEIGIAWSDGHESFYDSHALRCACGCATCIDEMTGKKVLIDEKVPKDVRLKAFHPVGNYGVALHWSDEDYTVIYTFKRLRELCPCEECRSTGG